METKKLIQAIRRYNSYCEHITLSTIFAKMRVGDGERFNIINYGPPGTGKSYSSIELLDKLGLGTDIILDNTTTRRGLFETFMDYPHHDIIIDECSAIARDKTSQDMIKLAMESKPLTWTKTKSVETTPCYTGNITLNVNFTLIDSLNDRCFVNKTLMNKKMALDFVDDYVKGLKDKKTETEFIKYIIDKIKDPAPTILTPSEYNYIKDFVKRQIELNDETLGYSRRIIKRMISYFKRVKKFYGSLNKEITLFVEPYAAIYVENRRTPTMIESLLGDSKMIKSELIKLIAVEGGYTDRRARTIVNDELRKGVLKQFGRTVYV